MDVLRCNSLSSSSFFLVMAMAGCMGTEVNKASTSYETKHSSVLSFMPLMLSMKSFVFLHGMMFCPPKVSVF